MKNKELTTVLVIFSLLISLIFLHPAIADAQSANPMDKEVKEAILAEDWTNVAKLLDSVNTQTPSPVLRLIKGHATLALNKNNKSLCLFLSTSQDDLGKWDEWSKDLLQSNPSKAIAYYLRGDALARLEKWDSALRVFNKALKLHPSHPLVLNARGVVYAAKGELEKARVDFNKASKKKVNGLFLADTYCNSGFLNIQTKDGAVGAINHFEKALNIFSDFALVLHGRGLVEVVFNHIEEADGYFNQAIEKRSCVAILQGENLISMQSYMSGLGKKEVVAMYSGKQPGTSLRTSFGDAAKKWDTFTNEVKHGFGPAGHLGNTQRKYNAFHESFKELTPNQKTNLYNSHMRSDLQNDAVKNAFGKTHPNVLNWTKPGGGADVFTNTMQKTLEIGGCAALASGHPYLTAGALTAAVGMEPVKGHTKRNYEAASQLNNLITHDSGFSTNPAAGIEANLAEVHWDKGRWPFDEYYGLLYGIKSKEFAFASKVKRDQNESDKQK